MYGKIAIFAEIGFKYDGRNSEVYRGQYQDS